MLGRGHKAVEQGGRRHPDLHGWFFCVRVCACHTCLCRHWHAPPHGRVPARTQIRESEARLRLRRRVVCEHYSSCSPLFLLSLVLNHAFPSHVI